MMARSLGHGFHCGVVQFIKGSFSTGEEAFFRCFPDEVDYHVMGEGYTWETQDKARDILAAEAAWQIAAGMLADEIKHGEIALRVAHHAGKIAQFQQADVAVVILERFDLELGTILRLKFKVISNALARAEVFAEFGLVKFKK